MKPIILTPVKTSSPNPLKKQPKSRCKKVPDPGTSLQLLVNRLVGNSLNGIDRNKCIVVNEVPSEFRIAADEMAAPVISELLTTMVANARNGRIYINAQKFRDVMIVEMQERNNYNGYALAFSLKSIEPQAFVIGGNISITGIQKLETTVSFSFPN
ncbi:MAG: hypothetical protein JJE22_04145 [Bacteroidia bacterium]|nr:hypothetical protein [Bacteroidia bacterium]